jgi:short-subunit dehydrogenase
MKGERNLMETVLITGTSSGIGYETAILFAKKGYRVIATMRNLLKAQALQKIIANESLNITIKHLDVSDNKSIELVVNEIIQKYGHLDILINNAGAGFLGTLEQTTLSQAQEIMDVNFFGVWRLTQAVMPFMRKNKLGHIISVSSIGGLIGQPFNDAYSAAKFAVEGLMESLAPVVKKFGIHVSLIEPGPVNSDFVSSLKQISPALTEDLMYDYQPMLGAYLNATGAAFAQSAQNPEDIAEVILEAAMSKQPCLRYQTSELYKKFAGIKLADITGNQVIALTGSRLSENIIAQ